MKKILSKLPGILLITTIVIISMIVSKMLLLQEIIISSAFISILIGLFVGNFFKIENKFQWFIELSLKKLLRIGIAFLGIGLSINELINYGYQSFFLISINIIIVFIIVYYICKLFNVTKKFGYLITMGSSICGVTAVIATSSIIKSSKDETGYAVGVVTLFGMIAVLFYPYLANHFFTNNQEFAGIFLGTSIHDTAQVSAAALIYYENYESEIALNSAMTTKLLRNSYLLILIPLISYIYNIKNHSNFQNSIKNFFPFFVFGFITLSIIRTLGDEFITDTTNIFLWEHLIIYTKLISKILILFAMAALGLQTNLKNIFKLGFKPLLAGFFASISVGLSSLIFLKLLS
tara:strand:- start:853 stop:1896 length:1044 start_codon:yes stop_codon:yes gene_type:complete